MRGILPDALVTIIDIKWHGSSVAELTYKDATGRLGSDAAALAKNFRSRSARKIYWALVAGVPRPRQGRISTFLAKEEREEDSFMRIAQHGEEGASHAITYYAVVETAATSTR